MQVSGNLYVAPTSEEYKNKRIFMLSSTEHINIDKK
jgi:hypothetical protein